jgi:hypothetical protein
VSIVAVYSMYTHTHTQKTHRHTHTHTHTRRTHTQMDSKSADRRTCKRRDRDRQKKNRYDRASTFPALGQGTEGTRLCMGARTGTHSHAPHSLFLSRTHSHRKDSGGYFKAFAWLFLAVVPKAAAAAAAAPLPPPPPPSRACEASSCSA